VAPASHEDDTMNETTGGRRRPGWCRARPRRAGVLAVTAGLVLLTAACGGNPSSTGRPSSTGTGGVLSKFVSDELAFARCVRAHGVPNYPDPLANGQYPPVNKHLIVGNPRFPAANRACGHLIPQSVITALNQVDLRQYVRFAACMRTHGVPNMPDPTTEADGSPIFILSPASIDTNSPQVRAAAFRCQSLLHLAQLPNYVG
jgi:hypothetical protein